MTGKNEFRGLTTYTKKWVYGYLVCYGVENCIIDYATNKYIVDGESVSQYIGTRDKNGKNIFQNDIVKGKDCFNNEFLGIVKYGTHIVTTDGGNIRRTAMGVFLVDGRGNQIFDSCRDTISVFTLEIIGNIHENKDLMILKRK